MGTRIKRIFPTRFEALCLAVISILILIIGNTHSLLSYYGLGSSTSVLKQGVGDAVSNGLGKLDSLSLTDRVVTFLIWAFVGMLCFSIVQAIARVYGEFKRDEELSSNTYVHPSTFTRAKFWKSVLLDFLLAIGSLLLLGAGLYVFSAIMLPAGLAYSREFLLHLSLIGVLQFVAAIVIITLGLLLLDVCVRLFGNRHHLLA